MSVTRQRASTWLAAGVFLLCARDTSAAPVTAEIPASIGPLSIVSATSDRGSCAAPAHLIDGDRSTQFRMAGPNSKATVIVALPGPFVLTGLRVVNGIEPAHWIDSVAVSGDGKHFRELLGRWVNLPMWRGGDTLDLTLPAAVATHVRVVFFTGSRPNTGISEIAISGWHNRPERHLLCWASDVQRDFLDQLETFAADFRVTDLWLDYVASAFPQTNHNSGFAIWRETGVLDRLRQRGIRYWLGEHESFCGMVNAPADLHDDQSWETTFSRMRTIYAEARGLGFRGLVYDAEDYGGVTAAARKRYAAVADHVDGWAFADEFGLAGMYFRRGRQVGEVIRSVWPEAILIQLYEAALYAGISGCRDGNVWWLRGIHDAGVEIWIATEKTYGAGEGEVTEPGIPGYCRSWFVNMPQFVPKVHAAYPFATRVLPGFHPWNSRLRTPVYLPRYLQRQLDLAAGLCRGHWLYFEGTAHGGDPRVVLDADATRRAGATPEEYLDVLRGNRKP